MSSLVGAHFSVPVTLYVIVDCLRQMKLKTDCLNLIDIVGAGFPPTDTHVHLLVIPEITVDGPVIVHVWGRAERIWQTVIGII